MNCRNPRYRWDSLSNLRAILRQFLILFMNRSAMLRSLHRSPSYSRGDLRFDLGGIAAPIPLASIRSTNALESYPLSAIAQPSSNPAIRLPDCVTPCFSPPVKFYLNGLPSLSTAARIFALNPPPLFPRSWDSCPPLFWDAPAAAWLAFAVGAVDEDEVHVGTFCKGFARPPPDAPPRPSGEALIGAVPVAVLGREHPPRRSGARHPHHGFDESLAILFIPDPYIGIFPQKIVQVNSLCQHALAASG